MRWLIFTAYARKKIEMFHQLAPCQTLTSLDFPGSPFGGHFRYVASRRRRLLVTLLRQEEIPGNTCECGQPIIGQADFSAEEIAAASAAD